MRHNSEPECPGKKPDGESERSERGSVTATRADRFLIVAVFAAAAFLAALFWLQSAKGRQAFAVVEQDGQEILRLRLDQEETVRISCAEGYNVISVKDGRAAVSEADCRDQICVNQGEIRGSSEVIVCLPHKLTVRLEGAADEVAPDAVTN